MRIRQLCTKTSGKKNLNNRVTQKLGKICIISPINYKVNIPKVYNTMNNIRSSYKRVKGVTKWL